jgi:ketosteroid isomerase-like protein
VTDRPPPTQATALAALDALVEAFSRTDTGAYFGCLHPQATFVLPGEPVLGDRAAYRARWDEWVASGWRVEGCRSTERRVQLVGGTALVTHRVLTTTTAPPEAGGRTETDERETVVLAPGDDGRLLVVHEHLSPTPLPTRTEETAR